MYQIDTRKCSQITKTQNPKNSILDMTAWIMN